MGNLTPVFEGVAVGALTALVLFLICLVVVKRRLFLRRQDSESRKNGYTLLDTDSSATDFLEKRNTPPLVLPKCDTVQPVESEITLPYPETEPRKPRSTSCPDRRNAISELSPKIVENKSKSSETPGTKERRKSRRLRKSKSDSCDHVCQIQFTVFYNYYHSTLTLQLVNASKVPSAFGLNYGSYIEVELQPSSQKYTTKTQLHTNNPVFDEIAEFPEIASDELLNMTLGLRLFTVDRLSHSTMIGQVQSPLAELDLNPENPTIVWRPVTNSYQQSRVSSSLLSLKDIVDKGDLTVSLKYQILTNKVTVVIMKAANLPSLRKIFAIDPYVIVKLSLNLKTVQTKKTSIRRRTTSPIWNEPLVFEIDSKIPITEYSMSFKVKSHNSFSEDLTVGEIEIGHNVEGSGRQHWDDMVVRKNQDRAMCHKIK